MLRKNLYDSSSQESNGSNDSAGANICEKLLVENILRASGKKWGGTKSFSERTQPQNISSGQQVALKGWHAHASKMSFTLESGV